MDTVLDEPGGCSGLDEILLPLCCCCCCCRDVLSLGCGSVADDPAGLTGDEDAFAARPLLDLDDANSASEAVLRRVQQSAAAARSIRFLAY